MVAWFIIAIATLAVFAFIAINGVQTVASTTDAVGRVETARRLDSAASALIARAASPAGTGKSFVLAGTSVDGVYGLPGELSAFAYTPFGQRIVYCPFGDGEAGTASTVPLGAGTTYNVQVRNDAAGKTYVTDGRPGLPQVAENPNLLAYLVAPRTKTSPTPTCSSVRWNPTTRRFEAADAFVRAVTRTVGTDEAREQMSRDVVFYVSPTGNGRGYAVNDPTQLITALDFYRTRQPAAMRIVFAAGSYLMPANYLNIDSGTWPDRGNNPSLTLTSTSGGVNVQQTASAYINTPGDLTVNNVGFDGTTSFYVTRGRRYRLSNTIFGGIQANASGEAVLTNVTVGNSGAVPVAATSNGKITLNGTNVITPQCAYNAMATYTGGQITIIDSNTRLASMGGCSMPDLVYVEDSSSLNISNSVISLASNSSRAGFYVAGRITAIGSTFRADAYVQDMFMMRRTSTGHFATGQIVGTPQYGITDYGASSLSGSGFIMRAVAGGGCYASTGGGSGVVNPAGLDGTYGQMFLFNAPQGPSSAIPADEIPPGMSATPTSTEVANYSAAIARNQKKQLLRAMNSSLYTCNN